MTKLATVVTPAGIALWPHLVEPDDYAGQLNYKTGVVLDPKDPGVSEFIAMLDEASLKAYNEGVAELKALGGKNIPLAKSIVQKVPYDLEYDDEGEETGRVIVQCKSKAAGINQKTQKKWERKIPLFDSGKGKGRPAKIPHGSVRVWGGSVIKVEVELFPYCATGLKLAGVSLRIKSAQILQAADGSSSNNFGVEEDYEAVEQEEVDETEAVVEEDSDGDY